MPSQANKIHIDHEDIVIAGGGFIGTITALAAAKLGLKVTIIEAKDPKLFLAKNSDGRASALALGSIDFLREIDCWSEAMQQQAGPINDILIIDNHAPSTLHFDKDLVSDQPMGYMIDNQQFLVYLYQQLERQVAAGHVRICQETTITALDNTSHPSAIEITLSGGKQFSASLLVVADGRASATRDLLGMDVREKDYRQTAIVCTVKHEKPHQGLAVEHFMPAGPFAILPLADGYHSSLVWTEYPDKAAAILAAAKEDHTIALRHIAQRFGDFLGELSLASPLFSYPLKLIEATDWSGTRALLLGDAAHGIHPIAGQGLNLGIRDIAEWFSLSKEHQHAGLDIGSDTLLDLYVSRRKRDVYGMVQATDAINGLFSNQNPLLTAARRAGLSLVSESPMLKSWFMKQAMGV